MSFHVPERFRLRKGSFASDNSAGNNGAFFIHSSIIKERGTPLKVIASDGMGWEHVSVSLPHRTPTWEEMCVIKAMFWDEDDCVIQYHPPRSEYVNNHPYCLHLWRPIDVTMPIPHSLLIGIKGADTRSTAEQFDIYSKAAALTESGGTEGNA